MTPYLDTKDDQQMTQAASVLPTRGGFLFGKAQSLLLRAGQRGFWPMTDQAVVSIGNFLTAVLVARGLERPEFGTFGVVLEFMFFMNNLQSGLITFPLTVRGAVEDDAGLKRLVTASTLFTLLLGLPVVVLTLIIGGAIGKLALAASAVVALVVWQLQETTRRGLWAHFRHRDSILGDAISYIGQAIGIWILSRTGHLSLVTIFGVMTLTSLIAALVQAIQIGVHWIRLSDLPQIMREFWKTGRWVALTNASVIVGSICGSWALWLAHGRTQVADFFAIANLMKLANPVLTSIGGLITPASAKRFAQAGIYAARRTAAKYALLGAALLGPYLLFILAFPGFVMRLMYGAGKFAGQENSLRGCAIGYLMIFTLGAMTAFLNGVHKARYSFYGQLIASVLQFVILLPLNIAFGVKGYVWGGVIQAFLQTLLMIYLIEKAMKEPATIEPEPRGFEPIISK